MKPIDQANPPPALERISEARLLGDELNEFEKCSGGSSDALRFS
jgi:hypothetical protein